MRILHVYKTYLPDTVGGVEQVIKHIVSGCSSLGIESEILVLSPNASSTPLSIDGQKIHQCQTHLELASTPFSLAAFTKFRRLAKHVDLIHYHYPYPFADFLHLFISPHRPALVTYHSDIIKQKRLMQIYRPLQRRFLTSMDAIVTTSPNYLESSKTLTSYQNKTHVIPIGLDPDSYPIPTQEQQEQWSSKFGSRFFLFVGVLRYYKGLHILMEAAQNRDYPIVIVGAGPVEAELKKQAAYLKLHNVHFLGFISEQDKVALLQLCTAVVFPSHLRSEAFGISLLEGAMYGKPMISSEIGTGTTYININHETGIVTPPSNPKALQQAMDEIWANPSRSAEMGIRARQRFVQHFTLKKMASRYSDLYSKLITAE